jgi:hypothetical protein
MLYALILRLSHLTSHILFILKAFRQISPDSAYQLITNCQSGNHGCQQQSKNKCPGRQLDVIGKT